MLPLRGKATLPPGFIKTRNHQHSTGFLGFSLYKPATKRTEYDNTTYSSTEQTISCTCLVLNSPTIFTIGSIHWPTKVQSLGNGPLYHCVPSLCFHCLSFPFPRFWAVFFSHFKHVRHCCSPMWDRAVRGDPFCCAFHLFFHSFSPPLSLSPLCCRDWRFLAQFPWQWPSGQVFSCRDTSPWGWRLNYLT